MDNVFELTLDLPARNAIDHAFLDHFEGAMEEAGERAILLRGTPGAFCAGLNLKLLPELEGQPLEEFLIRVDECFGALFLHPAPVVACVEGHAIAGGCVILSACDHRVCAANDGIRIGVNEVALGACYPPRALGIMRARLSPRNVERVVLGSELYAPDEALELGLLDECGADPLELARAAAQRLSTFPGQAYGYVKRELRTPYMPDSDAIERWRREALPQWAGEELRGRIRAALAK